MKTQEIQKHLHRAVTSLNAYISEKPNAIRQIARLHLLVIHYEELLRSRGMEFDLIHREAA